MTREEAIEVIEQDIPCEHDTDLIEALEMAIKALEQEPCEDTVSRKEIIEHYTTGEMANVHHIDKNHLLAFVEQLPPVRPQPCEDAISREDAIAEINDTIARYIPLFYGRTVKIPLELDRAIMRVPSVRPQLCDDAISREWLKTAIHNFYYGLKHTPTEEDIQAYIDVAPSVRPQEQTGTWKEIVKEHKCYARDDTYTTTEYHCSECGAEPFENEDGFYEFGNYCPNCGARMVEPQESEVHE